MTMYTCIRSGPNIRLTSLCRRPHSIATVGRLRQCHGQECCVHLWFVVGVPAALLQS